MKIKHMGEKYGTVTTVLPKSRGSRQLSTLDANELAQLFADLVSLPQPTMRQAEPENLAKLVLFIGRKRYGHHFPRLAARKIIFPGDMPAAGQA